MEWAHWRILSRGVAWPILPGDRLSGCSAEDWPQSVQWGKQLGSCCDMWPEGSALQTMHFSRVSSVIWGEHVDWLFLSIYYFICSSCLPQGLAVAHGLSCSAACGILVPRPGIEPASLALQGRFLTAVPPGQHWSVFLTGVEYCFTFALVKLRALIVTSTRRPSKQSPQLCSTWECCFASPRAPLPGRPSSWVSILGSPLLLRTSLFSSSVHY